MGQESECLARAMDLYGFRWARGLPPSHEGRMPTLSIMVPDANNEPLQFLPSKSIAI